MDRRLCNIKVSDLSSLRDDKQALMAIKLSVPELAQMDNKTFEESAKNLFARLNEFQSRFGDLTMDQVLNLNGGN